MTIQNGFFKSINGDRRYLAEFFTSYFASFIGNGVFPNPSTNLQVIANQNFATIVRPGKGWINGHYLNNDDNIVINHQPPDGVLRRIDRIVFAVNLDSRSMDIYLKQGTPSTNAQAPGLLRNSTIYELALADIAFNPGMVSISQSNITDQRMNGQLCGIVHGVVEQLDTTTLFNQYQQFLVEKGVEFDQQLAVNQQVFDDWFANLEDILEGDVAANLTNMLLRHTNNATNQKHVEVVSAVPSNLINKGLLLVLDDVDNPNNPPEVPTSMVLNERIDGISQQAQQNNIQLKLKVDKVDGKQLSTNDYSNIEKALVAQIPQKADLTDIANISSGTPLFASSIAEMIDTSRLYVNTGNNNNIYVYTNGQWTNTGVVYTPAEISNNGVYQNKLNDLLQDLLYVGFVWSLGSINSSGINLNSSTRVRTDINFLKKGTVIKLTDSSFYKYAIHYFREDQSFISQTGFITNQTTLNDDSYVRFIVAKQDDSSLSGLIDEVGNKLIIVPPSSLTNPVNSERIGEKAITSEKIEVSTIKPRHLGDKLQRYLFKGFEWYIGTVLTGGATNTLNTRIHTKKTYLTKDTIIDIENPGYKVGFHRFSTDGQNYIGQSGFQTSKITIPESTYYMLVMAKTDDSVISNLIEEVSSQLTVYEKTSLLNVSNVVLNPLDANVKAVAHRGYSSVAPECTLPAYKLAKEKGFSYVECDVIFTADGVPVLSHLDDLSVKTNGTGLVSQSTLSYIKTLDAGSSKSVEFAGTPIPTFEEFLLLCKRLNLHPYIEIKIATIQQVEEMVNTVKRYGMLRHVTWIGALTFLRKIIELDTKARVGWVTSNITDSGIASIVALKTGENEAFANLDNTTITQEISDKCANAGIGLECYTVNSPSRAIDLSALGVSGITTDGLNIAETLMNAPY